MKTIWKYEIRAMPSFQELMVPKGSEFLSAQMQNDLLCLWFKVDSLMIEHECKSFVIFGTGQKFDDTGLNFLSTVQDGRYVWHLFEVAQ